MDPYEITRETLPAAALIKGQGHKFSHGHALVISGGAGRSGAARLAARGALRIGAGLVTLAVPPAALAEVAGQITALMVKEIASRDALTDLLRDDRINALCVGPGLGRDSDLTAVIHTLLVTRRATVVDADALTLIGQDARLFTALHDGCVITPHGGEFARLFPDISERLAEGGGLSKPQAAAQAAARAGCVVVLKGAETVVADPQGRVGVHRATGSRAAPWLATAGSGDVLAGFITGLMARGIPPLQAAQTAVYLHVDCALSFGPGLIAEDLAEELPPVLRGLLP